MLTRVCVTATLMWMGMGSVRILVADDDAWILRMVTTVLQKRGYDIDTAVDGEEALELAIRNRPDLVITDVMMPKVDGWSLVRQLRARPEFAFVPMIFLTALGSDEDRIRGFRLGADDYLPKPFRFEELDLRVANALKKRKQVEEETRASARAAQPPPRDAPKAPSRKPSPGLRGTLEQVGLSSLLTLLDMEKKSGVLILSRDPTHEAARIFLKKGRIVMARIDGHNEPKNQDAIYYLLSWINGVFEFSALDVEMDDEVKTSTMALLMEGARRLDETSRDGAA